MAVEARHLNLFPSQLLTQREMINSDQGNSFPYNAQMGTVSPLQTVMPSEALLPLQQSILCDSIQQQAKTSMKADSGLTYNLPPATIAAPRKRSRDSLETFIVPHKNNNNNHLSPYPTFLGEEISWQIHQHQLEINQIIAQHSKKIRLELEERQKHQERVLISAIGEGIMKKLKEKDEQIHRMAKLNLVLQERVKSLYVENQLWRDLAQTNEAAANSLRSNLEQVLAHVGGSGGGEQRLLAGGGAAGLAVADEAESCCGSSDHGRDKEEDVEVVAPERWSGSTAAASGGGRMCRKCWERESCVLLLPCRHLCVCATCGSQLLHTCPLCNSNMNATVHVNMS